MLLKLIIFAYFASIVHGQTESTFDVCSSSYLCTDDFCSSCPPSCNLADGSQCDGVTVPLHDAVDDFCACCTYSCIQYLEEGEKCDTTTYGKYPDEMCGPGLTCRPTTDSNPSCQPMTTPCHLEVRQYEEDLASGNLGMNVSPPECDDEGFYAPRQCYREGPCRCVDKESGEPIFGFSGGEAEADEDGQDCQCARNYYEGLQQGCKMTVPYYGYDDRENYIKSLEDCVAKAKASSAMDNVFFPRHMRCFPNGNFDPLQCVTGFTVEDMCFCVEPNSLELNSTRTYKSSVSNLDCFDEDSHTADYYQPCERIVQNIAEMTEEMASLTSEEGGSRLYFPDWEPKCSPDGFFDKVQHDQDKYYFKFCSDRDGEQIEDFRIRMGSKASRMMNCECAFARRYLSDGVARPTCCENGNFEGIQCQSGWCFCVDQWGRQVGKEMDQLEVDLLTCSDWCYESEEGQDDLLNESMIRNM